MPLIPSVSGKRSFFLNYYSEEEVFSQESTFVSLDDDTLLERLPQPNSHFFLVLRRTANSTSIPGMQNIDIAFLLYFTNTARIRIAPDIDTRTCRRFAAGVSRLITASFFAVYSFRLSK